MHSECCSSQPLCWKMPSFICRLNCWDAACNSFHGLSVRVHLWLQKPCDCPVLHSSDLSVVWTRIQNMFKRNKLGWSAKWNKLCFGVITATSVRGISDTDYDVPHCCKTVWDWTQRNKVGNGAEITYVTYAGRNLRVVRSLAGAYCGLWYSFLQSL